MKFMKVAACVLIVMSAIMLLVALEVLYGSPLRAATNALFLFSNLLWARIAWVVSEVM